MNSTLQAIEERYSCRAFTDEMPSDAHLSAITQAAIQAPSGMNQQNWQVILVKNQALMADMDKEGLQAMAATDDPSAYNRMMARGGTLFYNAPCMVVIAIKKNVVPGIELIDCGILAQNIVLAATSLGLASVHFGLIAFAFAGSKGAEFKERLQIPEGYECGLAVLLGYAKDPTQPHAPNPAKITIIE